eukprot:g4021.t1
MQTRLLVSCLLVAGAIGFLADDDEAGGGGRAGKLGKSTYAMVDPFAWKAFAETYLPTAENMVQANSTTNCVEWVKLCIDDGHMTSCSGPQGNTQLHSVGAYKRESGALSMAELEARFSQAMGGMATYDPFMDQHVAFYTADLDYYADAFDKGGVAALKGTFVDEATGGSYSTVTVHAEGMQVIEIMGNASATALGAARYAHAWATPRASAGALRRAEARAAAAPRTHDAAGKPVLQWLHASFASSDVARDAQFFEKVLMGTKVGQWTSADGKTTTYAGMVQAGDATEVRFVQSAAQSRGPWQVADWEKYISSLHAACITDADGKDSGFDRLADFHLGHAMAQTDLTPYIAAVKARGLPYRFYGQASTPFFYVYMPNGWGIQLIGQCSGCPSGGNYDFCTGGTIGSCKKQAWP